MRGGRGGSGRGRGGHHHGVGRGRPAPGPGPGPAAGRYGRGGGFFGGIFGFFAPPPPVGYFRAGPPLPLIGRPGFRYHHPHIVPAMVLGGAVAAAAVSSHIYYVPRGENTCVVTPPSDNLQYYSVEIPPDVYPGELFRVVVNDTEILVTCPDVSGPGQRIIVAVESDHVLPTAIATPVATAPHEVIGSATILPTATAINSK